MEGGLRALVRPLALAIAAITFASLSGSVRATAPSDAVLGYVVLPNIESTLSHADALAKVARPDTPPDLFRKALGEALGDPGLTHLRRGAPVVFVVLRGGSGGSPPTGAWLLPVTHPAPVEAAFGCRGWKTRTTDGLLAAAPTSEALEAAEGERGGYGAIAGSADRSDASLTLRMDRVTEAYEPMLRAWVEVAVGQTNPRRPPAASGQAEATSPAAPPTEGMRIWKLELDALVGLLQDSSTLRWDLSLKPDAIRSQIELTARPGTALAELTSMLAPSDPTPALVDGGGALTEVYHMDPRVFSSYLGRVIAGVATEPGAPKREADDLLSLVRDACALSSGQMTSVMRGAPDGGLISETVLGLRDETKFVATLDRSTALLISGTWGRLYESMGILYTGGLHRDVRRHAGVSVHRMSATVQVADAKMEQAAIAKASAKDMEVAVTHGYYLASQDSTALDAMIDRAIAGSRGAPPMQPRAAALFGLGRHAYFDYDFPAFRRAFLSLTPHPQGSAPSQIPPSGEPISLALSLSGGVARAEASFPVGALVDLHHLAEESRAGQPVPFTARNATGGWAVDADIKGRVEPESGGFKVVVERCVLARPDRFVDAEDIVFLQAAISRRIKTDGTWTTLRQSRPRLVRQTLKPGEKLEMRPFEVPIPTDDLEMQKGDWLTFSITTKTLSEGKEIVGSIYVHAPITLPRPEPLDDRSPLKPVDFEGTNYTGPWAVFGDVMGRVEPESDGLKVVVKSCVLTRPRDGVALDVVSIQAGISRTIEKGGTWRTLRESGPQWIRQALKPGQELDLPPFELKIPTSDLEMRKGDWLTFNITVKGLFEGKEVVGFNYVQVKPIKLPGSCCPSVAPTRNASGPSRPSLQTYAERRPLLGWVGRSSVVAVCEPAL